MKKDKLWTYFTGVTTGIIFSWVLTNPTPLHIGIFVAVLIGDYLFHLRRNEDVGQGD
jgi:hypothetical protein